MANVIGNNNAMVPPPPMPPSVASVSRRGGGASFRTSGRQNCAPTAASGGKFTPPSRIVRVQPGTRSSAISSLSTSHEAHTASAISSIPINPMDPFDASDSSDLSAEEDDDALLLREHIRILGRGNQTTTLLRPVMIQLAGKWRRIE